MRTFQILPILLTTVLFGCGQSGETFSGTYVGTEKASESSVGTVSQTVTLTLSQSGNSVTGTFSGQSGATGGVTGTASDGAINDLTITETDSNCHGKLTGTASLSNGQLTATFKGPLDGNCGNVNATLTATKSQ